MSKVINDTPQTDTPPLRIALGILTLLIAGLLAASCFSVDSQPVLQTSYSDEEITQAKNHDTYTRLYAAQIVVVGTVVKRDGPVAAFPGNTESHPEWILQPTKHLYQNKQFAQKYDEYTTNGGVPDADLEKKPYLFSRGFGEKQVYLGPATDELIQVATIAAEQRRHDDAVLLHQAKTNPDGHPLFKAIRTGKNVATVKVIDDRAASVSIDRAGNVEQLGKRVQGDRRVVLPAADVRGKLPEDGSVGSYLHINPPLPRPAASQPLIVVWELEDGRARAIHVETMQEATLRIAAAAMNQDFDSFSLDAHGPQHGSSRGSEGPVDNHHEADFDDPVPVGEEDR